MAVGIARAWIHDRNARTHDGSRPGHDETGRPQRLRKPWLGCPPTGSGGPRCFVGWVRKSTLIATLPGSCFPSHPGCSARRTCLPPGRLTALWVLPGKPLQPWRNDIAPRPQSERCQDAQLPERQSRAHGCPGTKRFFWLLAFTFALSRMPAACPRDGYALCYIRHDRRYPPWFRPRRLCPPRAKPRGGTRGGSCSGKREPPADKPRASFLKPCRVKTDTSSRKYRLVLAPNGFLGRDR